MSDEPTAPADEQDQPTPTDEAPIEGQAPEAEQVEAVDLDNFDLAQVPEDAGREWFEGRYRDLRGDYTRKTQELAEQRKQVSAIVDAIRDPNHPQHSDVMDYLGLETVEEDNDEYGLDEDEPLGVLEQRLARLEAEREAQAQAIAEQQAESELEDYLEERISDLQRREGIDEFSEQELRLLVNAAVASPDSSGKPDVEGAFEALKGAYAAKQKAWLSSKTAPRVPGAGVPASAELDVTDRAKRLSEMERIAEAAMGD